MPIRELVRSRELLGRVAREHRAAAIRIGRIRADRTRRAPFGIGLADDDGRVLQFWKGRDDGEAVGDGAKLIADAHAHMAIRRHLRRPFRVKRDEIQRRADVPRRVVRAVETVLDEVAQDGLRARAVWARDFRAADLRGRQGALEPVGGEVVQLHELFGCAVPVTDVRLVPDFPPPCVHFTPAVLRCDMTTDLVNQLAPLCVVRRRVRPAGVDVVVVVAGLPEMTVRLRMARERLGHEAELDEGLHLARNVGVDDAIEDRPVVDGVAGGVFGVDVGRSPLERGRAVAAREQIVRAEVNGRDAGGGKLGQQLLTVRHVGVIGFIVAEPCPHRRHRTAVDAGVHADIDVIALPARRRGRCDDSGRENRNAQKARSNPHTSMACSRGARW